MKLKELSVFEDVHDSIKFLAIGELTLIMFFDPHDPHPFVFVNTRQVV